MKIRIVVTGRSYHAAEPLPDELDLPDGQCVDDALGALQRHLPADGSLPASCLVIVTGQHVGTVGRHENRELREGDELTLIAPVAGGC